MKPDDIQQVMEILREECCQWPTPAVTVLAAKDRNPFTVLVSCIISLRTRDSVTAVASDRLFARADTPAQMLTLSEDDVAALIYPAGFYRAKACQICQISRQIIEKFGGVVPDGIDQLLTMKGVGRKTANLVVTLGYGKPGICVDTHVHRIVNRWGYVKAATPDKTEAALRLILPREYWIELNDLLVCYGQNRCTPLSPFCSVCKLSDWCNRIGVERSR